MSRTQGGGFSWPQKTRESQRDQRSDARPTPQHGERDLRVREDRLARDVILSGHQLSPHGDGIPRGAQTVFLFSTTVLNAEDRGGLVRQ